jgi:hypothetical protein
MILSHLKRDKAKGNPIAALINSIAASRFAAYFKKFPKVEP